MVPERSVPGAAAPHSAAEAAPSGLFATALLRHLRSSRLARPELGILPARTGTGRKADHSHGEIARWCAPQKSQQAANPRKLPLQSNVQSHDFEKEPGCRS